MTYYATVKQLEQRLRMEMPVRLSLPCPISGQPFEVDRENLLRALIVDASDLELENRLVAAQYAEMARLQRAAERAAGRASVAYAQWKAARAQETRASPEKVTEKGIEEKYRIHPDYQKMADAEKYYTALAGLFHDMTEAFRIKSRSIDAQLRLIRGGEGIDERPAAEGSDDRRVQELEQRVIDASAEERNRVVQGYLETGRLPAAPNGTEFPTPPAEALSVPSGVDPEKKSRLKEKKNKKNKNRSRVEA
jgi:hypothetical protein